MRVEARAKINWTLDIVGRRPDGYHLMDMLMQPVSLCDRVLLEPAEELRLRVNGASWVPNDTRNLAYRAAAALREATGCRAGADIRVDKAIPVGAGMGGGSADAAATLLGLNRLWGLNLPAAELERIGLTLGADVPFCLRGGLARVTGIGETLEPLPCARSWELVVVQPCRGLSTGAVFQAYHERPDGVRLDTRAAAEALASGDAAGLAVSLGNALQPVSEAMRPAIREAVEALRKHGALAALMTGSGSAVFGVFEERTTATTAARAVWQQWKRTWRCHTCVRSLVVSP